MFVLRAVFISQKYITVVFPCLFKKRSVEHLEQGCHNGFLLQPNKNQLHSKHSLLLFPPILFFVYIGEHLCMFSNYQKSLTESARVKAEQVQKP